MKNFKMILFSVAFLAAGLTVSSCGNSGSNADKQGKEYTSEYVCPMHCEGSGSDKPGKCPVCGMDYKKNKDHKGHDH
ncbi:MAG TPA: hypothetical protein ENJ95_09375 [Bacteroidetes bacterium]|nr:hypothetical protein [Bacteroidota bacterium]